MGIEDKMETIYLKQSIIDQVRNQIGEAGKKLRSSKQVDGNLADKAFSTVDAKREKRTIELLDQILKAVNKMDVKDNKAVPSRLVDSVKELSLNLSLNETIKVQKLVNNLTRSARVKCEKEIEANKDIALKALNVKVMGGLGGSLIHNHLAVHDRYGKLIKFSTLNAGIDELAERLKVELRKQSSFETVHLTTNENNDFEISDKRFPANLMEMVNKGYITKNADNRKIIDHFNQIKEAFMAKEKLKSKINALNGTISLVQGLKEQNESINSSEIDYKDLEKYLSNLKDGATHDLKKIESYIDRFEFKYVIQEIKVAEVKERLEQERKNKMFKYATLSYELEKAKAYGDQDAIYKAQEEMRLYGQSCDLIDSDIMDAIKMGADKFNSEQQSIEIAKEDIRKKEEMQTRMLQEEAAYLREAAIAEIEAQGGYKGDWSERSGDVYDSDSYEAAIERKIEELKANNAKMMSDGSEPTNGGRKL